MYYVTHNNPDLSLIQTKRFLPPIPTDLEIGGNRPILF